MSIPFGMIIRDLVSPRSVRYLLMVRDDSLELLRIEGRSRASIVCTVVVQGTKIQDWETAFTAITSSSSYWGQPLEVLLNTKKSFAYIRQLDSVDSGRIRELVEPLQTDDTLFHYQIKRLGQRQYLLAGGIDKQLYDNLHQILVKSFHILLGVKLLTVHLAERSLTQMPADKPVIQIFDFGKSRRSLVCDGKGHVVCSDHSDDHASDGANGIASWAQDSFLGSGASVDTIMYSAGGNSKRGSEGSVTSIASVLGSRLSEPAVWKDTAVLAPVSSSAKAGSIALNSLRLLLQVLGSLLLLALALFITTSVMSSGNAEVTDEYQSLYSEQVQIDRSIDSVKAAISELHEQAGPGLPSADIMAAFCQIRYYDAYLTQLDISPGETTPVVEAFGIARTERAVFRYSRKLAEYVSPFEIRMNSVSPQIDRSLRPPDTIVTFRMSLVTANDNQ